MESKIIDRIRKLQALAGNNPSEEEAAAADVDYSKWIVFFPQAERSDYFRVAARRENGEVTIWDYTLYGAFGHVGRFKPSVHTKPVTRKAERAEVDRTIRMIERGKERSQLFYETAKELDSLKRGGN